MGDSVFQTALTVALRNLDMHWTVDGANAIRALRRSILSNRFDDFRECRPSPN